MLQRPVSWRAWDSTISSGVAQDKEGSGAAGWQRPVVTAEHVRFSLGLAMASNGRCTSTQRHCAAMAGDEHAPVRPCFQHHYQSTRVFE